MNVNSRIPSMFPPGHFPQMPARPLPPMSPPGHFPQMPARPLPPCPRKHIRISSSVFFSSLRDERFGAKTSHTSDFYCLREKALVQLGTVNPFILFRSLPSFCRAPLLHFPARTFAPDARAALSPNFCARAFAPGPRAAPSPNFCARTFPPGPRAVPSPICLTVSL